MVAPLAVTPGKLSPTRLSVSVLSCERQWEASAFLPLVASACNSQIVLQRYALKAPAARFPEQEPKQLLINANEGHVDKSLFAAH